MFIFVLFAIIVLCGLICAVLESKTTPSITPVNIAEPPNAAIITNTEYRTHMDTLRSLSSCSATIPLGLCADMLYHSNSRKRNLNANQIQDIKLLQSYC